MQNTVGVGFCVGQGLAPSTEGTLPLSDFPGCTQTKTSNHNIKANDDNKHSSLLNAPNFPGQLNAGVSSRFDCKL
jgi:hypothetical protein